MKRRNHSDPSEEERNRVFQSRMEWLKTVYDFYKHFMTVAFASIAAVAAVASLIGGGFKKTFGADAPLESKVFLGAAILAFLITGYVSGQGMHLARRNILHLHEVESDADFEELRKWRWGLGEVLDRKRVWGVVRLFYGAGVIAFGIYVLTAAF